MSSILLVYTTSVDIDQDLLSLMSQPHNLVHYICMSDVSDYCILLNFANKRLKIIYVMSITDFVTPSSQ